MPRRHPPEKKQAVLADVPALGISGAAKAHGVGKATVSRWAEEAGIGTVPNERTQKATEAASLKWAERRAGMVDDLGDLAADTLEVIRANLTEKPRTAADLSRVLDMTIRNAQLLSGGHTARHSVEERGEVLTDARQRGLSLVR